MAASPEIVAAVVAAATALILWVLSEIIVRSNIRRTDLRRDYLEKRLRGAYGPAAGVLQVLVNPAATPEQRRAAAQALQRVVRHRGYLLSARRHADLASVDLGDDGELARCALALNRDFDLLSEELRRMHFAS